MQSKEDNKRQTRRRKLFYYLKVENVKNNEEIGRVIDISHGGFLCSGKGNLQVGRLYDVKIQIPKDIAPIEDILCEVSCIRISNAPQGNDYLDFALEITHIEESEKEKMEDLIFRLDMRLERP